MDNNQTPEQGNSYGASMRGVQPDYATNLAALGVKMTPDGRVKSLGLQIGEIVAQGGGDLDLETAMDWAKRAEIADAELSSLVVDSVQMLRDLEMFRVLEPESGAAVYAIEGLKHLQSHMEKAVFGFMYGVEQGDEAKKAIFGPTGRSGE